MPFDFDEKNRQLYEFLAKHQQKQQSNKKIDDDFAQVYIEENFPVKQEKRNSEEITPLSPATKVVLDRLGAMRQIFFSGEFSGTLYEKRQAALFVVQGKFMVSFEDYCEQSVPMERYYPDYQGMSNAQLRTYFTWRTKARKGIYEKIDLSYVFVYIYEIINNIGITGQQGMQALLDLWQSLEELEPKLNNYMPSFVKDYYIVNNLPYSYEQLRQSRGNLTRRLDLSGESLLDFYAPLSPYKVQKSAFYQGRQMLLNEYFTFVISQIEETTGVEFDELVFFKTFGARWQPFSKALYFDKKTQEERKVSLSKTEVYFYKNGYWYSSKKRVYSESGRLLVEAVIRKTEDFCRKSTGYKNNLKMKKDIIDTRAAKKLGMEPKEVERLIENALSSLHMEKNKVLVTLNPAVVEKIRVKALETQEKLIVEEEPPVVLEIASEPPKLEIDSYMGLTPREKELLRLILKGSTMGEITILAKEKGEMLEVMVEAINEKAMEEIGDSIIDLGETAKVYEDYMEEAAKAAQ